MKPSPAHGDPILSAAVSPHLARLAGVDGEIGVSAFVAFAWLNRLERLSPDAALGIAADRAAVYDWYLNIFAPSCLPERAPLSDGDVAWLLGDDGLAGLPFVVPRCVALSALKPFSQGAGFIAQGDERGLAEWWVKRRAPEMGVEDRLVPARYRDLLGMSPEVPPAFAAPALTVFKADVEVAGPLSRATGLARAGRASVAAFEKAGLKVKATDLTRGHGSRADEGFRMPPPIEGPAAVTAFQVNPDMLPLAVAFAAEPFARRRAGIFVWELDRPSTADFLGLDLVNEIWAASRYVRDVYAPVFTGEVAHVEPTVEAPGPVDRVAAARTLRARTGLPQKSFVFLSMFDGLSYLARKNPLAAVEAFTRAFPARADVALVLKGQHRPLGHEGGETAIWRGIDAALKRDPRIRLIDATLSYDGVMELVAGADAFVSLHRSEGFGLGPAEAMLRGVPVVVTGYGGTEDFCSDATAMRVPYRLVDVPADGYLHAEPGRVWADPDVVAAADSMRRLVDEPGFARGLGEAGRASAARQFSVDRVAEGYAKNFERLVSGRRGGVS